VNTLKKRGCPQKESSGTFLILGRKGGRMTEWMKEKLQKSRVPGDLAEMKKLKALFDQGSEVDLEGTVKDPLTVAGLLKLHFREGREDNVPKRSYHVLYSARGLFLCLSFTFSVSNQPPTTQNLRQPSGHALRTPL